jgi:outer membrane protein assembly factor BamB
MYSTPNTGVLAAGQGMVFVEGPTNNFSVLRSSDGERMWNIGLEPGEPLAGFPIFASGVVYIITNLRSGPNHAFIRRIVALAGRDASELWSHPLEGRIATLTPGPVGVGASSVYLTGTEFFGNHDEHYLYSVSAQTGNVRWKYPIAVTGSATVSATEAGNLVYVANSGAPYLDAVRVSDGQRVWRHDSSASVGFSAPVGADGVLFVKSLLFNGNDASANPCRFNCEPLTAVYALDAASGSLYWHSAWSSLDVFTQPWVTTGALWGSEGAVFVPRPVLSVRVRGVWSCETRSIFRSRRRIIASIVGAGRVAHQPVARE